MGLEQCLSRVDLNQDAADAPDITRVPASEPPAQAERRRPSHVLSVSHRLIWVRWEFTEV